LSPGTAFVAGTNQLVLLQFMASTNTSGTAALALDNSVVKLEFGCSSFRISPLCVPAALR